MAGAGRMRLAEEALSAASSEPLRARALAQQALAGGEYVTHSAEVVARRALGVAARTQMQIEESLSHFAVSLTVADAAKLSEEAALTRVSRAMSYGLVGRYPEALTDIDAALQVLVGQSWDEGRSQKAIILAMMGRFEEALALMAVTIRAFHRSGNTLGEARGRLNRSYVYMQVGSVESGEREANAARALFAQLDHQVGMAFTDHHLAVQAGVRGDIPAALERFARVAAAFLRLGIPKEQGADAEVAILLAARLASDARAVAVAALDQLQERNVPVVHQLLVAVAQANLLLGDYARAREAADQACLWFTGHGSDKWVMRAAHVAITARFAGGERSESLQADAASTANELRGCKWLAASLDAHLISGQVARALDDRNGALTSLLVAAAARRRGGLSSRLCGWHAQALVEMLEGRPKRAAHCLSVGLKLVDEFREVLGATELRTGAAGHAAALAQEGLRLAFETGRATEIFKWSERYRAAAMLLPPVRPPKDHDLAVALARLRSISAQLSQSPPGIPTSADSHLEREHRRLEREVRQLAHRVRGTGVATGARPSASAIRRSLGDATFLQILTNDHWLYAIALRRSGVTAMKLGAADTIRAELGSVRFALSQLARRPIGRSAPTMLANLLYGIEHLDELIFGPLRPLLSAGRLIISPPGELHLLPWSMLPTARVRQVTVAPSAATWLRAALRPPPRSPRCVLAAGPGLKYADTEVLEIARLVPGRHALIGPDAQAAVVARTLGGASIAHLACHGRFRADNPSFSALELYDGPLYVYDLERLRRAPHTMVLSACDSGHAAVTPGDELSGLTSALLAVGTQAIIASVLPVRDDATVALMGDLHRHLAAGAEPAAALSKAQTSARESGSISAIVAAGSFTCFGAGWPVAVQ